MKKLKLAFKAFYAALMSEEIDSKEYRKWIYLYLQNSYGNKLAHLCNYITDIKVYTHFGVITVVIETHKPGLIIGVNAEVIDGLESFVRRRMEFDEGEFRILVEDSKLFKELFK